MATPARSIGPIETRPLVEQAREALLQAIGEDRFPGGRLPPEAQLTELLGVSRGTLRAALQSLRSVVGFACESAAPDITGFGSWPAYLAAR